MPVRRLDEAGLEALRAALVDPVVLARYRAKVTTVPGSECLWWTGAVAGRSDREATTGGGHGRFWFAPGRVIIAHRLAFAAIHGVDALAQARPAGTPVSQPAVPADRADARGRLDRAAEPGGVGGAAAAALQPAGRPARELRDLAREDPQLVADDLARLQELLGEQLTLW